MTVREALAGAIEDVWEPLARGEEPASRMCPVCPMFRETHCKGCPVLAHFGVRCKDIPAYLGWALFREEHPSERATVAAKGWLAVLKTVLREIQ